jgi:hypothetical protein
MIPPPQKLPAAVRERILTQALDAHIDANTTFGSVGQRIDQGQAVPMSAGQSKNAP